MKKSSTSSRGFTLVELLVAIGIIGVLTAVVITSQADARAQARDKERQADIGQIQLAVRLYAEANRSFPASTETICSSCSGTVNTAVEAYIGGEVEDPKHDGSTYFYEYTSTEICANQLERVEESYCVPVR